MARRSSRENARARATREVRAEYHVPRSDHAEGRYSTAAPPPKPPRSPTTPTRSELASSHSCHRDALRTHAVIPTRSRGSNLRRASSNSLSPSVSLSLFLDSSTGPSPRALPVDSPSTPSER
ncbi:hypothetical protein PUN28_007034 [Cardiocondyla obscurior]|uniref:Uncharacterized protein n=1 Tax=Cardiocondyla obscurior TaxID=286306 RepID=A0AAW2G3A6_9HYME